MTPLTQINNVKSLCWTNNGTT